MEVGEDLQRMKRAMTRWETQSALLQDSIFSCRQLCERLNELVQNPRRVEIVVQDDKTKDTSW